ncbi:5552_t:CDS:2 [Dentiscutata erythropus]|uniref:5552_t:CDS:1 n=1 Tax=Dentiscutata erythropus TaxID=1348616 RepID=A0A9N9NJA2_9GLOM|nr:5552_t:CDS:2 [Dentiscutata erythropus]
MTRRFNHSRRRSSGRHLRGSSDNPLFEALDVVQTENRRLVREIISLRRRIRNLEERVEVQQETIVESVQGSWMRDAEYERLLVERNRLRARVADLEERVELRRDNNNDRGSDGSRDRMVGFGFFGGGNFA